MGTFLMCLMGSAVIAYAVLMLLGAILGNGGLPIGACLAGGVVFALFACVLEKLTRVEEKLDKLLRDLHKDTNEE